MEQDNATPQGKIPAVPILICLLLIALTLAVFWRALGCDFVDFDDPDYFSSNPHVSTGLSLSNVIWALTTIRDANWHPMTWLSLMLDAELFGKGPVGPHLTNLLFHAANTVLLFLLLRRLMSLRRDQSVGGILRFGAGLAQIACDHRHAEELVDMDG